MLSLEFSNAVRSQSPDSASRGATDSSGGSSPASGQADSTGPGGSFDVPDDLSSVEARVDLGALRCNARLLQALAGPAHLMAVVKADAYGHGVRVVAPVLQDAGIDAFAVARPAEGRELRAAGMEGRILVLGALLPGQIESCLRDNLDVTVSSVAVIDRIADSMAAHDGVPDPPLRVHLKVDTGMHRLGVTPAEAPSAVSTLQRIAGVDVAGVWTHFATADEPGHPLVDTQRQRFAGVLDAIGARTAFHTDNTGALLTGDGALGVDLASSRSGSIGSPAYVRTGIALYGLAPTPALARGVDLQPVLSLQARVTHLHTIDAGETVSYGARWTADAPTRLATIGAGYGDGYPRGCSGRAHVRIGGALRPVVGTICMDMCMVDLGPPASPLAQRVEVGDAAILFGPDGPTTYDIARWADTIPYEVCCRVSKRVPRRYDSNPDARARPQTHT